MITSTFALKSEDIYSDSWAVIIGIDEYKHSMPLKYAVNDANSIKDLLLSKFNYKEENIRYLINEKATLKSIKSSLKEIADKAGGNDRILIFYSGHGQTLSGKDDHGYIIPYGGDLQDPYSTGIAMDEISKIAHMSEAKHMLFLMDACYSGLMTENIKGIDLYKNNYIDKFAKEQARHIITAGGKNEVAIERDQWQHSAFTKNLLDALDEWRADTNKDGYITTIELFQYLRISVTEDSDKTQTPQFGRFVNTGNGEFIFSNSNYNKKIVQNDEYKKIKIYVTSEQDMIDYLNHSAKEHSKNIDSDKNYSYKILSDSEIEEFTYSLIKNMTNSYRGQKYNFFKYQGIDLEYDDLLYTSSFGDGTGETGVGFGGCENDIYTTNGIFDSCECDDIWIISILNRTSLGYHPKGIPGLPEFEKSEYYTLYTGRFFKPKYLERSNSYLYYNASESLDELIKGINKSFIDGEIAPKEPYKYHIRSVKNDTLLIKVTNYVDENDPINISSMVGLIYSVVRPYYMVPDNNDNWHPNENDINNHEVYLSDLLDIKKYIENNNIYNEYLPIYQDKILKLHEELTELSIRNEKYGYSKKAWNERLSIDIHIIDIQDDYLRGVVMRKKFPWYNIKVNDELSLWH